MSQTVDQVHIGMIIFSHIYRLVYSLEAEQEIWHTKTHQTD